MSLYLEHNLHMPWTHIKQRLGYVRNPRSLMEALCRDDIWDLFGSPDYLWENLKWVLSGVNFHFRHNQLYVFWQY